MGDAALVDVPLVDAALVDAAVDAKPDDAALMDAVLVVCPKVALPAESPTASTIPIPKPRQFITLFSYPFGLYFMTFYTDTGSGGTVTGGSRRAAVAGCRRWEAAGRRQVAVRT